MTNTIVDWERETALMDVRELVQQLLDGLGKTAVATLAGAEERNAPIEWANPNGPMPEPYAVERLKAAHQCWIMLSETESAPIARLWFTGANPLLDGSPPVLELRDGKTVEVKAAAEAFRTGSW